MDLGSAIRVLLRRWLVVVIGMLLTLGAAGYLYVNTPLSYAAGARMLLLLPPDARGADAVGSPFLYLPNGLNVLAELVAVAPAERDFRQDMSARGLTSSFEVDVDPQTPIIAIGVEGTDPENVIATRDRVLELLQAELEELQVEEGAPRAQTAHAKVFAADDVPVEEGREWMRDVLSAVAAGAVVTLVAAFAIDHLLQWRRARRDMRPDEGASAAESDDTDEQDRASRATVEAEHAEDSDDAEDVDGTGAPADDGLVGARHLESR